MSRRDSAAGRPSAWCTTAVRPAKRQKILINVWVRRSALAGAAAGGSLVVGPDLGQHGGAGSRDRAAAPMVHACQSASSIRSSPFMIGDCSAITIRTSCSLIGCRRPANPAPSSGCTCVASSANGSGPCAADTPIVSSVISVGEGLHVDADLRQRTMAPRIIAGCAGRGWRRGVRRSSPTPRSSSCSTPSGWAFVLGGGRPPSKCP